MAVELPDEVRCGGCNHTSKMHGRGLAAPLRECTIWGCDCPQWIDPVKWNRGGAAGIERLPSETFRAGYNVEKELEQPRHANRFEAVAEELKKS